MVFIRRGREGNWFGEMGISECKVIGFFGERKEKGFCFRKQEKQSISRVKAIFFGFGGDSRTFGFAS